ncbi:response regulator transcription factor [Paractinoplanes rishiriensis]|uniref:DNA-binding response regulator n=1 Tax=Paractinoplanes rishiriensis TaxID=1050105 RepID=A0A919KCM9_9ACTN|nr:response regulator transcription factor [Actinoplanes rishiriensis]GIF01232.1 DNA-binding response regulator [Actinoplanes rishiriensis]
MHGECDRRVLLVEDDPAVQRVLAIALSEEGFRLSVAGEGRQALELLPREPVAVMLLDLMLPDLDGLEVCRRVRTLSEVPIIVLTARADSHDMVAGLESGADDYIVKPFVAKVLAARIRALLRRCEAVRRTHPAVVSVGPMEIMPAEAVVRCDGSPVSLTRTEFRLIVALAERPGEVVGRDELLREVWGYEFLGDGRLVDVHIRRLRAKVERDPSHPRHLVTVRGLGYKLQP